MDVMRRLQEHSYVLLCRKCYLQREERGRGRDDPEICLVNSERIFPRRHLEALNDIQECGRDARRHPYPYARKYSCSSRLDSGRDARRHAEAVHLKITSACPSSLQYACNRGFMSLYMVKGHTAAVHLQTGFTCRRVWLRQNIFTSRQC